MSIKEIYKNLLVNRYNNKKYYNNAIELDYNNNVIRIASPNCSNRLVLKPTDKNSSLIQQEHVLSGDMFAFVVTELIIDYLLTNTKENSKLYLSNLANRVNTDTEVDAVLNSNKQSISINKILGYFNVFVNSYWS